ncbi:unnamed protein product [Sphacelaria rigidula]
MKFILALFVAFVSMAAAFVPAISSRGAIMAQQTRSSTPLRMSGDGEEKHIGTGGMADTRDPEPTDDPDPRKSISAAPTFEEYMKQKKAEAEGK